MKYRNKGFTTIELLVWVPCIIVIFALSFRGVFVSDEVGVVALENQGFSNIHVTDNSFFAVGFRGCDAQDAARITAVATNSQGKDVTLYVCAGWPFKGATVRNP